MDTGTIDAEPQGHSEQLLSTVRELESLFHHPTDSTTADQVSNLLDEHFIRVTPSGDVQDKSQALAVFLERWAEKVNCPWHLQDERLRRLSEAIYLYSYSLHMAGRVTRRSTIWSVTGDVMKALHHQGTLAAHDVDHSLASAAKPASRADGASR
ncbi:hypothetical protein D8W71_02245 [Rhodococcus sp. P1Y]|nr:hypothetical protein D8W71_02245 [Rhodococcus sp. P1Y]